MPFSSIGKLIPELFLSSPTARVEEKPLDRAKEGIAGDYLHVHSASMSSAEHGLDLDPSILVPADDADPLVEAMHANAMQVFCRYAVMFSISFPVILTFPF